MHLGLDLGTTNVKALVTGTNGESVGQGRCAVQLFHVGADGVEQDFEQIWSAAISAIRQATSGLNTQLIRAIGVSSQGGALQVLDSNQKPLGRVISWLDRRGQPYDLKLTTELGEDWFAQRVGHRGSGLVLGQLLRLRRESPAILAQPNRVSFVGDALVQRLCGRAAQDGTSGAMTLLYDAGIRDYDSELRERLGLEREQLPDLISPRRAAGSNKARAASATGLPAGLPVSTAIHDQYAAALGAGAVAPGAALLGAGTAWVLLTVSLQPTAPATDRAFACHHVIEGLYGQIVSMVNGGSALAWATELMGVRESEIEGLLTSTPAGSGGVRFWPFLAPAVPAGLGAAARGRLSGLQLTHAAGHVVRAVVEGLAFELKRHLSILANAGVTVERLLVGGAAAASSATARIIADVTGKPVGCVIDGGSALGAAIVARGLVEPGHSLAELSAEMVPRMQQVLPGANAGYYEQAFTEFLDSLPYGDEPLGRPWTADASHSTA
jgi:xylulokinase